VGGPPNAPGGQVGITVQRSARQLDIVVTDDGVGLPEGFSMETAAGLGLQIVRTLVAAELLGTIEMGNRAGPSGTSHGTTVHIVVPLRGRS
jgi:two-component sensor histidine kinase